MGKEHVATPAEDLLWRRQVDVRVAGERCWAALGEKRGVGEMRPRPHPQVATVLRLLVAEHQRREHRERARRPARVVAVNVRTTGSMWVRRKVERDLDLVEGNAYRLRSRELARGSQD